MTEVQEARGGRVVRSYEEGVLVLRLEDEPTRNALSSRMLADLAEGIRSANELPGVRGLVVTGTGRAFSSGENLLETAAVIERAGIAGLSRLFNAITEAVLESPLPCVVAVNGVGVGGAAELTLCFDRRIGSPDASFVLPESRMGFTVSNAATYLLPELVGRPTALELVLTGRRVYADEAHALGLLDEVVPAELLLARCVAFIHEATPPGNTAQLHLAMLRPESVAVRQALGRESGAAREAWESGRMHAKIDQFGAKRDGGAAAKS